MNTMLASLFKQCRVLWPFILIILMFVAVLAPVFFGGRTVLPIVPSEGVTRGMPYGYVGPLPQNLITIDPVGSLNIGFIFDQFTAQHLRNGILPLWNPYQALGQPFLANGISAALYPFTWLNVLLSPAWADMIYLLHWVLTALFFYAFLRLFRLPRGAVLVGTASIFGSGLFPLYLAVREYPSVVAWFPLLLYAIERTIRHPQWKYKHLVLGLAIYFTFTAGQPEATFISILVAVLYGIARILMQPSYRWKLLGALIPGAIGGVLLATPMWLPFMEYALDAFSNHAPSVQLGLEKVPPIFFVLYFFPFTFGRENLAAYVSTWFPIASVVFIIASIPALFKKHVAGVGIFWMIATLTVAKIWGVPIIHWIGGLPLLDRVVFSRYSNFVLLIAFAALVAYGIHTLCTIEARRWGTIILVWTGVMVLFLALALNEQWPTIRESLSFSDDVVQMSQQSFTALLFMALGALWATIPILLLWLIRTQRPQDPAAVTIGAGAALLLQAVTYSLNGYGVEVTVALTVVSMIVLMLYTVIVTALTTLPRLRVLVAGLGVTITLVSLSPLLVGASHGLPQRYNPLTPAPYISTLQTLQDGGRYRSYSFSGRPQPNFSMPFSISSLGNVEAVMPEESAAYMFEYLDSAVSPIWFAGNLSHNRLDGRPAVDEFSRNKRYYDFIGVRYLVTAAADAFTTIHYDTETFGVPREPTPLFTPVEATFTAPDASFSEVHVLLSTYGKKNPGITRILLLDEQGGVLRTSEVDGSTLQNNQYQRFSFESLRVPSGNTVHVRIEFTPNNSESMIAAWIYPSQPTLGFAFRIAEPQYLLVGSDEAAGAYIWENATAAERVFLVPEVQYAPTWREALNHLPETPNLFRTAWVDDAAAVAALASSPTPSPLPNAPQNTLESLMLTPNRVSIQYVAATAGMLVLTDTYAGGWRVAVNGTEQAVVRVNGVFRGVLIPEAGTYTVEWWYRPPRWSLALFSAFVGAALIILSSLWYIISRKFRILQSQ